MKIFRSQLDGYGESVFLAVPTTGQITPETTSSLFSVCGELLKNNIVPTLEICAYDCHVDDQRNYLVRDFLESNCSQFVFIDSDIRFDPSDLIKLIRYKANIVGGVYPKKQTVEDFPVRLISNDLKSGLLEVAGVPTGFLKVRRKVFEKLYGKAKKYLPQKEVWAQRKEIPLIFERTLDGNVRWGGDYQFCELCKKSGYKIYTDPEMRFGHIGATEHYGSLGNYIRKENGLTDSHIVSLIRRVQMEEETVDDLISLFDSWGNEFSAPPDMLGIIAELSRQDEGKILEIGSGLTTLVLGASGRDVVSVESDSDWLKRINGMLQKCNYYNVETVRADIVDGWYDFNTDDEYSLILIDGPARKAGDRRKFVDHIKNIPTGCVVVVDDVDSGIAPTKEIADKFGVEFRNYDRFAVGIKR